MNIYIKALICTLKAIFMGIFDIIKTLPEYLIAAIEFVGILLLIFGPIAGILLGIVHVCERWELFPDHPDQVLVLVIGGVMVSIAWVAFLLIYEAKIAQLKDTGRC